MISWLVREGLVKDIIGWSVGFILGLLFAWLSKIMPILKDIQNKLDTDTPGGLGDVVHKHDKHI